MSTETQIAAAVEHIYGCRSGLIDESYGAECVSSAHAPALYRTFGCDHAAHVAAVLAPLVEQAKAEAWEEAGELADSVIASWQGVPGLHPTEPEPHPAAIAAAGARRTLVVLRSRMSEAFMDRAAALSPEDGVA